MGNKFSIKKSVYVSRIEYIKWVANARMIIMAVLVIFIKSLVIDPLLANASLMHGKLNILEPFIAIGNSSILILILPIVFITLICDFPRCDGNSLLYIFRTGKLNWFIGQVLFFFKSILTFLTVVFISSTLPVVFKSQVSARWSNVITHFTVTFPKQAGNFANNLIPQNLYHRFYPPEATVQTYIMLMFYMLTLALVMMLFNLLKKKKTGILVVGSIIALGMTFNAINSAVQWFFPMSNTILWQHYQEYFKKPVKSLLYSYMYFVIVIVVLIAINLFVLKKYTIDSVQEVD